MPYRYCTRCETVFYSAVSYTRFERCPNCDGPLRRPPADLEEVPRLPDERFSRRRLGLDDERRLGQRE